MSPLFWQAVAGLLYVLGACVTWAWAYDDGRTHAPWAAAWIALWPIFALIGSIWGACRRIRKALAGGR